MIGKTVRLDGKVHMVREPMCLALPGSRSSEVGRCPAVSGGRPFAWEGRLVVLENRPAGRRMPSWVFRNGPSPGPIPWRRSGNGRSGWTRRIGYICLFILTVGLFSPEAAVMAAPEDPAAAPAEKSPAAPKETPSSQETAASKEAVAPPTLATVPPVAGRLIDQEPYDRIFLDAANNNAILEVFPLDFPGRQVPQKPTQPLVVRLLNRPETKYEVAWSAVVKIELFEQRVLQEAQQFVQQGRFEEAYEYFQYLYEHYPKMAGLEPAYQEALWQEAAHWYRQGEYDRALAVLRTLWERNKDRRNLDRAMGMAVQRLVEQYVSAEDYESARTMLRQLAGWYPQHEVVAKWEEQFRTQAAALQQQAKMALEKGALREASEAARKMIQLWPTLPGAKELWQEVRGKYPRLIVGVCLPSRLGAGTTSAARESLGQNPEAPQPDRSQQRPEPPAGSLPPGTVGSTASSGPSAGSPVAPLGSAGKSSSLLRPAAAPLAPPSGGGTQLFRSAPAPGSQVPVPPGGSVVAHSAKRTDNSMFIDSVWWADRADWSARRTARLLGRCWMELVGVGSEGGQYRSPVASFQIEDLGRRLLFKLRPNLVDLHGQELTGYRLADLLLQMASPGSAGYRPEWADRVESVRVQDIYTVEVVLRRPHVRPEAFLSFPIANLAGPYQLHAASDREISFVLHPQYFAASAFQFKEIVEIPFSNPREALAALRAGKVDLLDRIPPTEVPRLQESKEIVVGQYALPVLHVLIVNPNRPLLANARFRRALEYGIPREEILAQICGGIRRREGSPGSPSAEASAKHPTRPESESAAPSAQPNQPNTQPAQQASQQSQTEMTSAATPSPPKPKPQIQRPIRLPPGFQVLSAPAPVGASYNDPIGYAYDRSQKARSYNPRLALALARLSWAEVSGAAQALLESPLPSAPDAPGAAGEPSATSGASASKPTPQPSTETGGSKQPAPKQPAKPEIPPPKPETPSSKEVAKPQEAPKTEPPPASEKKPVADPFADQPEPSPQTNQEKPPSAQAPEKPGSEPSAPPGEKPSPAESPKPPAEPKPPAQQPADPFAEGASAPLPEGSSTLLTPRGPMPAPVPTAFQTKTSLLPLLTDRGPVPAPVPLRCLTANFSWVLLEGSAPTGGADPFADEQPKPQPEPPPSEKSPPGPEKPASTKPTANPPEKQPPTQEPTAKAPSPSSGEKPSAPAWPLRSPEKSSAAVRSSGSAEKSSVVAGSSNSEEKPSAPASAKKPLGKVLAEEKPSGPEAVLPGSAPAEKPALEYLLDMPPLRLVHPPTEPARSACRQIRRMLRRVGIPIELHEVHPADLFGPTPPEFDLAYVELVIQEPVTDLPRLLTACGPAGPSSSFLALALADLYQAPGWPEVRQALYRLHQITVWEVPIVPLWQTVEYFAYRRSVQGIRERPIRLYENVEEWRLSEEASSPGSGPPKTPPGSQ